MKFGVQQIFQNYRSEIPDGRMWDEEVALGTLAEDLGFDDIWPVEHHFCDYAASVFGHYELMSEHFKKARGYEMYGSSVDLLKEIGLEKLAAQYVEAAQRGMRLFAEKVMPAFR